MKQHALILGAVALTLLVTSCSAQSSGSPASVSPPPTSEPSSSASAPAGASQGSSIQLSAPSPDSGSSIVSPNSGSSISSNTQSAPDSNAPKGKAGIATDAEMAVIDKVARAIANEKYDDAAAAGYYVFDSHGAFVQEPAIMASKRAEHADYYNQLKADYQKGDCQLVPMKINSSRVVYADMVCKGESAPAVTVHAGWMGGKFAYIDALYAETY